MDQGTFNRLTGTEISSQAAEIARLRDVVKWLTIDSAPKDGTKVLVYSAGIDEIFASKFAGGCWQGVTVFCSDGAHRPTHWQPLPQPPGGET